MPTSTAHFVKCILIGCDCFTSFCIFTIRVERQIAACCCKLAWLGHWKTLLLLINTKVSRKNTLWISKQNCLFSPQPKVLLMDSSLFEWRQVLQFLWKIVQTMYVNYLHKNILGTVLEVFKYNRVKGTDHVLLRNWGWNHLKLWDESLFFEELRTSSPVWCDILGRPSVVGVLYSVSLFLQTVTFNQNTFIIKSDAPRHGSLILQAFTGKHLVELKQTY